jgi:hypothetical protein
MAVRYLSLHTELQLIFTLCLEAHQLALCEEPHPATAKHDVSAPANTWGNAFEQSSFHTIYPHNYFS